MRWFVEISPLGAKSGSSTTLCVEAPQWQPALQKARALRGDNGALSNFSIELLDDGFRAIDPMARLRYIVRRAPDDAVLTASMPPPAPAEPAPLAAPVPDAPAQPLPKKRPMAQTVTFVSKGEARIAEEAPKPVEAAKPVEAPKPKAASVPPPNAVVTPSPEPVKKRPMAQTMAFGSAGAAALLDQAAEVPVAKEPPAKEKPAAKEQPAKEQPAAKEPAAKEQPAKEQPAPATAAAAPARDAVPSFILVGSREENPTESSPLTYRELVFAVAPGTPEDDARRLILDRFENIRAGLDSARVGKLINLAVFDHVFQGKPQRRPIVTLTWKDWKGPEPELFFPTRDAPPSSRSAAPASAPASKPSIATPAQAATPTQAAAPAPAPVSPAPAATAAKPAEPAPKAAEAAAKPAEAAPKSAPKAAEPAPKAVEAAAKPAEVAPKATEPAPKAAEPAPKAVEAAAKPAEAAPKSAKPAEAAAKPTEAAKPAEATAKPVDAAAPAEAAPKSAKPAEAAPKSAEPAAKPAEAAPGATPVASTLSSAKPVSLPKPSPEPEVPVVAAPQPVKTDEPAPKPAPVKTDEPKPAPVKADEPKPVKADEPIVPMPVKAIGDAPAEPVPATRPIPTVASPTVAEPDDVDIPIEAQTSTPEPVASAPVAKPAAPAAKPEPAAKPAATKPADKPAAAKAAAADKSSGKAPPTVRTAPAAKPAEPAKPKKRLSGDDLITELFEASGDLHFLRDALEGAEFVLALTMEKLPSEVGLVSLFDMNKREFVVVRQSGGPRSVLCARQPERAALASQAMRRRHAIVVADKEGAAKATDERFRAAGVEVKSFICAPVELAGRYLGLIEIANPLVGGAFNEGDGNALTYIGQQFAEFVAAHGVILDAEAIREPKRSNPPPALKKTR